MIAILFILLFVALFFLPLVPGLLELRWPRDARPLPIDQDYSNTPRQSGQAFRERLRPFLEKVGSAVPYRAQVVLRQRPETLEVRPTVDVPAGSRASSVLVSLGKAKVGRGGEVGEIYAQGDAELGEAVRVSAVACDGDLELGPQCQVKRWIDVEGRLGIGPRCDLG